MTEYICKGSITLNTHCGKCRKCYEEMSSLLVNMQNKKMITKFEEVKMSGSQENAIQKGSIDKEVKDFMEKIAREYGVEIISIQASWADFRTVSGKHHMLDTVATTTRIQ